MLQLYNMGFKIQYYVCLFSYLTLYKLQLPICIKKLEKRIIQMQMLFKSFAYSPLTVLIL